MGYDRGDRFPFDFLNQMQFHLIQITVVIPFGSENRRENCHHDHISFNVKGNRNIVFSVYPTMHLYAWLLDEKYINYKISDM